MPVEVAVLVVVVDRGVHVPLHCSKSLMYEISKYALSKFDGSCTKSRQVPGQVCAKTFGCPAKLPQMVVSMISVCGVKYVLKSQDVCG